MTDSSVQTQVLQIKHLPPLSVTASRLLAAMADTDVDIKRLDEVIGQDPGLSARILGMANSAYFSPSNPINTVRNAIIRVLGLNMVKSLALSITLCGAFNTSRCKGFDLKQYWCAALGGANLARMLATELQDKETLDADSVYLSALMRDLGMLVIAHAFPEELSRVLAKLKEDPDVDGLALEAEIIGIDRRQAGEWLACRWHLPSHVLRVMAHYSDSDYSGECMDQTLLVGAAARYLDGLEDGSDPVLAEDSVLVGRFGLTVETCDRIQQDFQETYEDLTRLASELA